MFQALVTQPPALYLAVIAGALLIALIQQLALSVKRGTVRSLENDLANREYVVEQQAVNIRALDASVKAFDGVVADERRKAGRLMIALTNASIAACKAADENARAFVKDRTDKALAAIVAADQAVARLVSERDEALEDLEDANDIIASLREHGGESGTIAEADFNEAAGEALRAETGETAAETGTRVHQTLDDVLFGGTPFKSGSGPDVIQAIFGLDKNGVAVPKNEAAAWLVKTFGVDRFTKIGREQAAEHAAEHVKAGTDDESCSTFTRPSVSLDDLKAALGRRNGGAEH